MLVCSQVISMKFLWTFKIIRSEWRIVSQEKSIILSNRERFGSNGVSSRGGPQRTKAQREESGAKSRAPPQSIGKERRKKSTQEAKFLHSLILDLDQLSLFYLSPLSCGASVSAACCVLGAVPAKLASFHLRDTQRKNELPTDKNNCKQPIFVLSKVRTCHTSQHVVPKEISAFSYITSNISNKT